jgi:hypothetical protein
MGSGFLGTGYPKFFASSGFLGTRKVPGSRVVAFLGMASPPGFLVPDVPKPGFLKVGTRSRVCVPGNGNPNLAPLIQR